MKHVRDHFSNCVPERDLMTQSHDDNFQRITATSLEALLIHLLEQCFSTRSGLDLSTSEISLATCVFY